MFPGMPSLGLSTGPAVSSSGGTFNVGSGGAGGVPMWALIAAGFIMILMLRK